MLCDIAYIEYAPNPKEFMKYFNDIKDNVLVLLASSCSKAFSYYGQRLGALIAINNDADFLNKYMNLCTRLARATWSNLNNAAMINISNVLRDRKEEYKSELEEVKQMLRKRTDLFIQQAKEQELEIYPYDDGFFVTLKMQSNKQRDMVHEAMMQNGIYAIKFNNSIRLALCSVPLEKIDGLPNKIKRIILGTRN